MTEITDKQMKSAAWSLQGYADYRGPFSFPDSIGTTDDHKPSIEEAYDTLRSLPADHPLRREFDFSLIQRGYDAIHKEGVLAKSVESLERFLCG